MRNAEQELARKLGRSEIEMVDVVTCVYPANLDQLDADSDGAGDACDVCPGPPLGAPAVEHGCGA